MDTPGFVTDIYLPRMLYALTIRSPIARGKLKAIECPKLPHNYTLISAQDIPGKNCLGDSQLPILAGQDISYRGEPVALLLGPDKNTLEDYSRHCQIVADEDVPVFSPREASDKIFGAGRIMAQRDFRVGDPETAFAQAASIVRGSYATGIQEQWYAEPTGAVVCPDEGGTDSKSSRLVVRTATQWPFHVRRCVAQVLGLAASAVLVKPTIIGLHMDGKLWYPSLISCHAALGAWLTERPVRLILTREEDFSFSPKRCAAEINIASALNEKGEITGIEIDTIVNLGSYGVNASEMLDHVNLGSLGVYKAKNIHISGIALRTNIPPQGPFAGFGLAQGFFAMERHVSRIAGILNQDPAGWRLENGIQDGTLPLGMPVKDATPVGELVSTVVKMSDYRRKWAAYELIRQGKRQGPQQEQGAEKGGSLRGIGIALGYQGNGLLYPSSDGSYSIELTLEKDGSLEIKTSMPADQRSDSPAAGIGSVWVDIASKILGVDAAMVRVRCSTEFPDAGPLTMSRNITAFTRLLEQACLAISKKRFRDPLPISVRKTMRPQKNPAWEACFPHTEISLDYSGFVRPGWASAIVEVEIDPIEYLPRIRGVWMGVDGGKIISEDRARKSLKVSAVQALGWAYREQINYVNGIIPADQFDNFTIPGPSQIPPITIDFIRTNQDEPKGIGDLPFTCIPAAYAQAVSQAMDRHFQSIPLKALDIWYAGVKKVKEGAPV